MDSIWENMKTAPQDGTKILLKLSEGSYSVGSWQYLSLQEGWFVGYSWNGKNVFAHYPIGWLEIPK